MRVKGSFLLPKAHPEFETVCKELGREGGAEFVSVPPTHPRFEELKASVKAAANVSAPEPPPVLSEREKYGIVQAAFAASFAYAQANEDLKEAERKYHEAMDKRKASAAQLRALTQGAPFRYNGKVWTLVGDSMVEASTLDFDAMSAKAVHKRAGKK